MIVILTAIGTITLAALTLGWSDAFHIIVGLLVIGLIALLMRWLSLRMQDDEALADKESETRRSIFFGVMFGLLALIPLMGAFVVTARTPLYGWFYDASCDRAIMEAEVLERAGVHEHVIALVDERRHGARSTACLQRLTEKKIRAQIAWADQMRDLGESLKLLQAARQEAERVRLPALAELIDSRLQAATQRQLVLYQAQELKRAQELLAQLQASQLDATQTADGVLVNLPDVLFDSGTADLAGRGRSRIAEIARALQRQKGGGLIRIEGHTDSSGAPAVNEELSRDRAASVAHALMEAGIPASRLKISGFASSRPVATNETEEGRLKNRRVEIILEQGAALR